MAKLESCPTCGNQTSENATQCPACGEPLLHEWAETVREQRVLAALAQKKAKWKKRLIWVSAAVALIVFISGEEDDLELQSLKESNPGEYQIRVQQLEAQVAKVPASDLDEKIRLYSELKKFDPDNAHYIDKIAHYQRKKKESEAKAKADVRAAKLAAEAAAEAENERKGFHCLSGWDGSHRKVKNYVEQQMRNPDSFEHIETRITPVNSNGEHTLIMKYRAQNGFGGMSTGVTTATVRNADCYATIVSLQ